jgi:hypothetical protein
VNRHKSREPGTWFRLARRRFLQAMLGVLSGIALPALAKRDQQARQAKLHQADFYHVKQDSKDH